MEILSIGSSPASLATGPESTILLIDKHWITFTVLGRIAVTEECYLWACVDPNQRRYVLRTGPDHGRLSEEFEYLRRQEYQIAPIIYWMGQLSTLGAAFEYRENLPAVYYLYEGDWSDTLANNLAIRQVDETALAAVCEQDALVRLRSLFAHLTEKGILNPLILPSNTLVHVNEETGRIDNMLPFNYGWAFPAFELATMPLDLKLAMKARISREPYLRATVLFLQAQGIAVEDGLLTNPLFLYAIENSIAVEAQQIYIQPAQLLDLSGITTRLGRLELDVSPRPGAVIRTPNAVYREHREYVDRLESKREKWRADRIRRQEEAAAAKIQEEKRRKQEAKIAALERERQAKLQLEREEQLRKQAAEKARKDAEKAERLAKEAEEKRAKEEYWSQKKKEYDAREAQRLAEEELDRLRKVFGEKAYYERNFATVRSTPRQRDSTADDPTRAPWTFRQWINEVAPL